MHIALKDAGLFREACYINGRWTGAKDGATIKVTNPTTEDGMGSVPSLSRDDAAIAVEYAASALPGWSGRLALERAELLTAWQDLIIKNVEDIAVILSTEQGKPLKESKGEILQAAQYVQWFAEECRRAFGYTAPSPWRGKLPLTICQAVGVAGIITPWNFPAGMIARKAAPALAAGCTVVIKPSSITPFTAAALVALAERAGFPPGVVNLITGVADEVGSVLAEHPKVRALSFTGSTNVGKILMAKSSLTMKRVALELGGNAPLLVFRDADLDLAVTCGVNAKFRNAGQTCISPNRFLVQKDIFNDVVTRFTKHAASLRVGPFYQEGVTVGPLINRDAVNHLNELVADAETLGAKILLGGKPVAQERLFFQPTVITGVTSSMRLWKEEIFGPVAAFAAFDTDSEAIAMANDTQTGLAAYLFTSDYRRIVSVSAALEAGMVAVNDWALATPEMPFGGVKESGIGREGSPKGMEHYLETKYILLGGLEI